MDSFGSLRECDESFQSLEYCCPHGACEHVDEADRLHKHLPVSEELLVATTDAFNGVHEDVMPLADFV